MTVLIWVMGGIISGFCCTWITGFRMSKGIRHYLEYSLLGGLGGVIGAVLTQDIIILFTYIFGYLYHIIGFFFDGVLTFAIIQLVLASLFLRYLHPVARKRLGTTSFLA